MRDFALWPLEPRGDSHIPTVPSPHSHFFQPDIPTFPFQKSNCSTSKIPLFPPLKFPFSLSRFPLSPSLESCYFQPHNPTFSTPKFPLFPSPQSHFSILRTIPASGSRPIPKTGIPAWNSSRMEPGKRREELEPSPAERSRGRSSRIPGKGFSWEFQAPLRRFRQIPNLQGALGANPRSRGIPGATSRSGLPGSLRIMPELAGIFPEILNQPRSPPGSASISMDPRKNVGFPLPGDRSAWEIPADPSEAVGYQESQPDPQENSKISQRIPKNSQSGFSFRSGGGIKSGKEDAFPTAVKKRE